MAQNTSSAVMQQRTEAKDSLEDFPTPPWATRALCEYLSEWINLDQFDVAEPAANRGFMARALREYFREVYASDIHDYGAGFPVEDYLFGARPKVYGFTITNPPFRLAEQFISRMEMTSQFGFAVFVRTSFLEGQDRYHNLFSKNPPTTIMQFAERVVLHKGVLRRPGEKYWDESAVNDDGSLGKWRKASTATSFCWLFWNKLARPGTTDFRWIEPCRLRLEREGDYE